MLTYLRYLPNLDYVFDYQRLSSFLTKDAALEFIKKAHLDHFKYKDNAYLVYDYAATFISSKPWKGVHITNVDTFENFVKNDPDFWQSHIFDFIKVY
jgi:hypothetical protein